LPHICGLSDRHRLVLHRLSKHIRWLAVL